MQMLSAHSGQRPTQQAPQCLETCQTSMDSHTLHRWPTIRLSYRSCLFMPRGGPVLPAVEVFTWGFQALARNQPQLRILIPVSRLRRASTWETSTFSVNTQVLM